MANEKKTTKVQINLLLEWEDYLKIKRVYGQDDEKRSTMLIRIVHDLVKDIKPTAEELKLLAEIYKKQHNERMRKRSLKAKK